MACIDPSSLSLPSTSLQSSVPIRRGVYPKPNLSHVEQPPPPTHPPHSKKRIRTHVVVHLRIAPPPPSLECSLSLQDEPPPPPLSHRRRSIPVNSRLGRLNLRPCLCLRLRDARGDRIAHALHRLLRRGLHIIDGLLDRRRRLPLHTTKTDLGVIYVYSSRQNGGVTCGKNGSLCV